MQNTAISTFSFMGLLEGGSLLVLVFIAMPLKYWAGFPEAVRFVGSLQVFYLFYMCL
jgi:integral membrane protein